ncbi:MAG: hypothetical protein AAFX99_11795, partial [Myxococcota bacterium]
MGSPTHVRADDAIDIRSYGIYTGGSSDRFVARLEDCHQITSVVLAGSQEQIGRDRLRPDAQGVCEVEFEVAGGADKQPGVLVTRSNEAGVVESYHEDFSVESEPPTLRVEGDEPLRFIDHDEGSGQSLAIDLMASDNVDVSYINVSVLGLRASDLRSVGGVIDRARPMAFADSGGFVRQYPRQGGGDEPFHVVVPMRSVLSQEEIQHDGIVLLEAYAVDASGNQQSISRLLTTGDSLRDPVQGLRLRRDRVVFNHILQTDQLTPVVTYTYRGDVEMAGAGRGISYSSSNPDQIRVSEGGLIYPVAPTDGAGVTITAVWDGACESPQGEPQTCEASLQVVYNPTLTLKRLELRDGDGAPLSPATVELPRLNRFFPLPALAGVFVREDPDTGDEVAGSEESF